MLLAAVSDVTFEIQLITEPGEFTVPSRRVRANGDEDAAPRREAEVTADTDSLRS